MLFKGPIPKFKYEANSFDRGLCIAGGSGITPMWQLITHSLELPVDKTKWTLVFSNVTDKDIRTYRRQSRPDNSVAERVGRPRCQKSRPSERKVCLGQRAQGLERWVGGFLLIRTHLTIRRDGIRQLRHDRAVVPQGRR
jgi:hypothetical protein